jgi:hypothetical protein
MDRMQKSTQTEDPKNYFDYAEPEKVLRVRGINWHSQSSDLEGGKGRGYRGIITWDEIEFA